MSAFMIDALKKILKQGDCVCATILHVSARGKSGCIDLSIPPGRKITRHVAKALGRRINRKHGGINIRVLSVDASLADAELALICEIGVALWGSPHSLTYKGIAQ